MSRDLTLVSTRELEQMFAQHPELDDQAMDILHELEFRRSPLTRDTTRLTDEDFELAWERALQRRRSSD